nr:aminoacyltransferase [Bacteroidales bacterium]
TQEAYAFFDELSFLEAFAYGVESEGQLKGLVVGYIQKDGGKLKQFFSRRAIIIGGPLLSEDIEEEELKTLLQSVKQALVNKVVFIETRNFNDYGIWRTAFMNCGFDYNPHLNFHVRTESLEVAQSGIGKHRWRYIRVSLRDGANLVDHPNQNQLVEFYSILKHLYHTKVKTPLFPYEFFTKLIELENAHFFLVDYEGKVIGGSVCVAMPGRAVYEWFVCGNENYRKGIRPTSVATWFGLEYAANNGCPLFDLMGAGKPNEPYGVRDFKAEFGGKLVEHGRFVYLNKPFLFWIGKLGVKIMKKL